MDTVFVFRSEVPTPLYTIVEPPLSMLVTHTFALSRTARYICLYEWHVFYFPCPSTQFMRRVYTSLHPFSNTEISQFLFICCNRPSCV